MASAGNCESSTVTAAPHVSIGDTSRLKTEPPRILTVENEEQKSGATLQRSEKEAPLPRTPRHANKREPRTLGQGPTSHHPPIGHYQHGHGHANGRGPPRQPISPSADYRYYSRDWQRFEQPNYGYQYPSSYRYEQRSYPPQHQRYPHPPYPYQRTAYEASNFPRAVSSSFEGQFNQVGYAEEQSRRNIRVNLQPASNSSSLTNSPVDGNTKPSDGKPSESKLAPDRPFPTPSKLAALDSLSSVASGQEPIVDSKKEAGPPSPGSSTASLDLMKCHSGSSGLLHGFGGGSFDRLDTKRSREDRGDSEQKEESAELRTSEEIEPTTKRLKSEEIKKKSPLGIDCSPSNSPRQPSSRMQARYTSSPGLLDKAPSYSYSVDSTANRNYPHITGPGSSASSTIAPMDRNPIETDGVGPSLPSWEIPQNDSFGNGSAGGVMSSFSFNNDYLGLTSSGSNLERREPQSRPSVTESRNQSFDHYPQIDPRGPPPTSHPQHGQYNKYWKLPPGQFPPHAPSWGTTQSTGSHRPPQYRGPPQYASYPRPTAHPSPHPPWVNRNFSEESAVRTSPPPGPPGHPVISASRQPPSSFEAAFAAPHNPNLARRPPPAVYIMSTPANSNKGPGHAAKMRMGKGIYSWTKDDDNRLSDIMKKYKNPRDWEPIAKEHGRGKNAKECHERWIRYLKPGVRKGQWQDHEDAIVVEAVTTSKEQPFTRWSDLAQRLPGRVGKQIRDRWVNHLNPNINHLPFSREDDLLLWEGHKKHGKRWVEISTKCFNSTRSENHIKNRWYSASFKKFISNEFGPDAYSGGKSTKGDKKGKSKKG